MFFIPFFFIHSIPCCSFSFEIVHFVFLFAWLALFHCRSALRVITNNHRTQLLLGYLKISANDIGSEFHSLASGRFLGHILCQSITRIVSIPVANIVSLLTLLGQTSIVYIVLSTPVFQARTVFLQL